MRVAVVAGRMNHHSQHALAFRDGLRRHGVEPRMVATGERFDADVAVFWGHRRATAIEQQRRLGRHYVVLERGYVGDRFSWTSVGVDGLNGRARWPDEADPSRWEKHFASFMNDWRPKGSGSYVLMMGQVPGDAALAGINVGRWMAQTVKKIRSVTDLPIKFRPHPNVPPTGAPIGTTKLLGPLDAALRGAAMVVTINSNSGVDAVLSGVPTVATDAGSMARPIAAEDVVFDPGRPDRSEWAHRMAWRQWTMDEIAGGAAWDKVRIVLLNGG